MVHKSACFPHTKSAFFPLLQDFIFINTQENIQGMRKLDREFEDSSWKISRRERDREEGMDRERGVRRGRGRLGREGGKKGEIARD